MAASRALNEAVDSKPYTANAREEGRGTGGNIGPLLDIAAELASTVQYQELKAPKGDACRIRDVEASAPDSLAAMG